MKRTLVFLFATCVALWELSSCSRAPNMKASEESLYRLSRSIWDDWPKWEERTRRAKQFEVELISTLQFEQSFTYPFSKLPVVVATSDDGKFRTYTWNTSLGGSWSDVAGVVQWHDESNILHVKRLEDVSPTLEAEQDTVRDVWIGAMYSEVHPLIVEGRTCYLVLGGNMHGAGIQISVVEIFEPQGSDVSIGKPIFEFEGRTTVRMLFSYSKAEEMHLAYDPEHKILKFDNLVDPPEGDGWPNWREPDGTIRVMRFEANHFEEMEQE